MFYVYAIKSELRNYIYVWMTNNLKRRFKEHNSGSNKTRKAYRPFILIFSEECQDRIGARAKEKYYKSGIGKEFLKSLIKQ